MKNILEQKIGSELVAMMERAHPVGNRVTCNPPPQDTDEDWLCVTKTGQEFWDCAIDNQWEVGGSFTTELEAAGFCSFVKKVGGVKINLIVTAHDDFEKKFLAASHVAKRLNVINKQDRIALFQAVLYANIEA